MDLILITQPSLKHNEANLLCRFFHAGLEKLHIRKPNHSALEVSSLLDGIPDEFLPRIIMHRHPELVMDYGLAGYHYADGEEEKNISCRVSLSIHSLQDLSSADETFEYVFFGPVYSSISKKGYKPKVPLQKIKEVITKVSKNTKRPKVYALGGIRRKRIASLSEVGFDGLVLLGSVWGNSDPLNTFLKFERELSLHHCAIS